MSIWDYLRNRIKPTPPPTPSPTPVTPPPAPPIDPAVVKRRQDALKRHAADTARFKVFVGKAQSTGFLPPAPPSPTWYENHPEYTWNPYEPNPERPEPPKPDFPKPKPIPQPTPEYVETVLSANKRWTADMDRWRKLSGGINNLNRPKSQPPSVTYYQSHPEYVWDSNAPQVR